MKTTDTLPQDTSTSQQNTSTGANTSATKSQVKPRLTHVYHWSSNDVVTWFRRHCGQYQQYSDLFLENDIVGRVLLRFTDKSLLQMGITDNQHRENIWREIVKLRLKTDIMEMRDLQRNKTK